MLEGPKIQEIRDPDFKLNEEVVAVFPDSAVYPLIVGQIYTITKISYDHRYDLYYYEIENYKEQIFDEIEFSSFFRHKKDIVLDPNKDENIQKFLKFKPCLYVKEGRRRSLEFNESLFEGEIDPLLKKKLVNLLNIINYKPEYSKIDIEDLWDYI